LQVQLQPLPDSGVSRPYGGFWDSLGGYAGTAWGTVKGYYSGLASSVTNGRGAWGTFVQAEDANQDLVFAMVNSVGTMRTKISNFVGRPFGVPACECKQLQRPGRFADVTGPLCGNQAEFDSGRPVGDFTVRAQATAIAAWEGAAALQSVPGLISTACSWGNALIGGGASSGLGGELAISIVGSCAGDLLGVGALGTVGALGGVLVGIGSFDPLSDWYSMKATGGSGSANTPYPKSPTGKGTVPPAERDLKRVWTKSENQQRLTEQDGKCARCGKEIEIENARGHHQTRHSDGGCTDDSNQDILCKDCHKEVHKP
jgi:hypothetical protein